MKVGDRIGRAVIVEFLDEPNTGLAVIEEPEHHSKARFTVPVWLLELAELVMVAGVQGKVLLRQCPVCAQQIACPHCAQGLRATIKAFAEES